MQKRLFKIIKIILFRLFLKLNFLLGNIFIYVRPLFTTTRSQNRQFSKRKLPHTHTHSHTTHTETDASTRHWTHKKFFANFSPLFQPISTRYDINEIGTQRAVNNSKINVKRKDTQTHITASFSYKSTPKRTPIVVCIILYNARFIRQSIYDFENHPVHGGSMPGTPWPPCTMALCLFSPWSCFCFEPQTEF